MADEMTCAKCGYRGLPRTCSKGSFAVEVGLFLFFLAASGAAIAWRVNHGNQTHPVLMLVEVLGFLNPAFGYTLWRRFHRYQGCPNCGSPEMRPS